MRFRLFWIITILVYLLPSIAVGQDVVQKDAQALSALTGSIAAMSAPGTIIQDSVVEGTIEMGDGTIGTVVFENKGSSTVRREINLPNRQAISVVNQGVGYSVINGVRQDLPLWVTNFDGPDFIPVLSRISDFGSARTNTVYVGLEDIPSGPAYHVRLSAVPITKDPLEAEALDLMSEFHVYIDAKTNLVAKTQGFIFSPETLSNRTAVDTFYGDYRQVGGILVPYRILRSIMGQKLSDVVITKVSLNTGLLDSQFQ